MEAQVAEMQASNRIARGVAAELERIGRQRRDRRERSLRIYIAAVGLVLAAVEAAVRFWT